MEGLMVIVNACPDFCVVFYTFSLKASSPLLDRHKLLSQFQSPEKLSLPYLRAEAYLQFQVPNTSQPTKLRKPICRAVWLPYHSFYLPRGYFSVCSIQKEHFFNHAKSLPRMNYMLFSNSGSGTSWDQLVNLEARHLLKALWPCGQQKDTAFSRNQHLVCRWSVIYTGAGPSHLRAFTFHQSF